MYTYIKTNDSIIIYTFTKTRSPTPYDVFKQFYTDYTYPVACYTFLPSQTPLVGLNWHTAERPVTWTRDLPCIYRTRLEYQSANQKIILSGLKITYTKTYCVVRKTVSNVVGTYIIFHLIYEKLIVIWVIYVLSDFTDGPYQ